MFGDNEATSKRTPSIHMGSDDDLSSFRMEYSSDDLSVSDRSFLQIPHRGKPAHLGKNCGRSFCLMIGPSMTFPWI